MNVIKRAAVAASTTMVTAIGVVAPAGPAAAYFGCFNCNTDQQVGNLVPCWNTLSWGSYTTPDQCAERNVDRFYDLAPPDAPSDLHGRAHVDSVALGWRGSSAHDVDHYVVYAASSPDGPYTRVKVLDGPNWDGSGQPPTGTGAAQPPATSRSYRVTAVDDAGRESAPSNVLTLTTTSG